LNEAETVIQFMTTEKEFLDYFVAVCKRPKMYTPGGTFNEVVSYLAGYALGADLRGNVHHWALIPFQQWIRKRLALDPAADWKAFRDLFSSDDEAVNNLNKLYQEYIQEL
jgi:hypothetical protein